MASLIEELIDVLEQECVIYEDLYKVSDTKTQAIVKGDIENLQKITENEQNVIEKVLVSMPGANEFFPYYSVPASLQLLL